MTTLEAIATARRLARYCRERAETSGRWRVWSDRALLLESAAADMEREMDAHARRAQRPAIALRDRVLTLLADRMPRRSANGADPFGHRRPRTLDRWRARAVPSDGPFAA
ncbi:MAG TPA: hypothetical protein VIL25_09385 [Vicinamibacterales bacterium]